MVALEAQTYCVLVIFLARKRVLRSWGRQPWGYIAIFVCVSERFSTHVKACQVNVTSGRCIPTFV